ncbi:hypothetical protein [Rhizobium changzhiense]|uniref:Uncharacterized protein n=1 Tax=Rhizobium changzhiense TaxID=2692317 RepID=A0ABR6A8J1_9HYPH|nr:hypothetical protein [Rhizobium changzhiense]MBA5802993.1 hypothetical protein [Rhizobium changzhiense]NNU47738.1 hypothetical protein [Rhizobium changzhiense]
MFMHLNGHPGPEFHGNAISTEGEGARLIPATERMLASISSSSIIH